MLQSKVTNQIYEQMRISLKAIDRIKPDTRIKTMLALALNRSVYTITKWIDENDDNLTKAAALEVIRKETGLTDSEILETVEVAGKI